MQNITTYLPEVDDVTLQPFIQAVTDETLDAVTDSFIDGIAADIEGATDEQIAEDKINFKAFILSEYEYCWEDREPQINERGEIISKGY